jgi:hypothetical protein
MTNHCCNEWFLYAQPVYRCLIVWDHAFGPICGLVTIG